jgi:hypothetical protein
MQRWEAFRALGYDKCGAILLSGAVNVHFPIFPQFSVVAAH